MRWPNGDVEHPARRDYLRDSDELLEAAMPRALPLNNDCVHSGGNMTSDEAVAKWRCHAIVHADAQRVPWVSSDVTTRIRYISDVNDYGCPLLISTHPPTDSRR